MTTQPERDAAGFFNEPCRCRGTKPFCIYCGGRGFYRTNKTAAERAEDDAKANAVFISKQYQGD